MVKDMKIEYPSANTELTIGIADLTALQIAENLELLSAIIVGVREGYARKKNEHECVIAFQGEMPFINATFEHQEWNDENFCAEGFIYYAERQEGTTIFTIPLRLAEWFKTDKTCCEYFRKREV